MSISNTKKQQKHREIASKSKQHHSNSGNCSGLGNSHMAFCSIFIDYMMRGHKISVIMVEKSAPRASTPQVGFGQNERIWLKIFPFISNDVVFVLPTLSSRSGHIYKCDEWLTGMLLSLKSSEMVIPMLESIL